MKPELRRPPSISVLLHLVPHHRRGSRRSSAPCPVRSVNRHHHHHRRRTSRRGSGSVGSRVGHACARGSGPRAADSVRLWSKPVTCEELAAAPHKARAHWRTTRDHLRLRPHSHPHHGTPSRRTNIRPTDGPPSTDTNQPHIMQHSKLPR